MKITPVMPVPAEHGTAVQEKAPSRPSPVPLNEPTSETESVECLMARRDQVERRLQHLRATAARLERTADACNQNLAISSQRSKTGRSSPGICDFLSTEHKELERTYELLANCRREESDLLHRIQQIDTQLEALMAMDLD